MKPALHARGLKKSYGRIHALAGLDVEVERGELVVLLGPNGAGKSTLFRLLTGLEVPDDGSVTIDGLDIARERTRVLSRIGIVFQQQTIDVDMSVYRNLHYHALLHGIPRTERKSRIARALDEVQLGERQHAAVKTLSGGNRRRVELARALLHAPRLLLMDEPTVGLDPESRRDLVKRVSALRREQGMGVLWATHLVDEAAAADRVIVIHHGSVLAALPPEQLLARTQSRDLSEAFLALTGQEQSAALAESIA